VLFLFLSILTILRENIGLSVGQFMQFWPIVLFLFSHQILKCIIKYRCFLFIKVADICLSNQ
jgi:hypothetical protein